MAGTGSASDMDVSTRAVAPVGPVQGCWKRGSNGRTSAAEAHEADASVAARPGK